MTVRDENMSDTLRKVDYYSIQISNKPGEAFKVLSALASAGIDLLAFTGFPRGRRSQIDVVPEDGRKFNAVARDSRSTRRRPASSFRVTTGRGRSRTICGLSLRPA